MLLWRLLVMWVVAGSTGHPRTWAARGLRRSPAVEGFASGRSPAVSLGPAIDLCSGARSGGARQYVDGSWSALPGGRGRSADEPVIRTTYSGGGVLRAIPVLGTPKRPRPWAPRLAVQHAIEEPTASIPGRSSKELLLGPVIWEGHSRD